MPVVNLWLACLIFVTLMVALCCLPRRSMSVAMRRLEDSFWLSDFLTFPLVPLAPFNRRAKMSRPIIEPSSANREHLSLVEFYRKVPDQDIYSTRLTVLPDRRLD